MYNHPHWSSEPRNEAARGLPWLASRNADEEVLDAIRLLVRDPVPSVRFLAVSELYRLIPQSAEMFWSLADEVAEQEDNLVVLFALSTALGTAVRSHERKVTATLTKLYPKATSKAAVQSDLLTQFVALVMWLAIVRRNEWAVDLAEGFLDLERGRPSILSQATLEALGYLKPAKNSSAQEPSMVAAVLLWLGRAISAAAERLKQLVPHLIERQSDQMSDFKETYGVIDQIVTRLCFSADVIGHLRSEGVRPLSDEERKHFYLAVKPLLD